MLRIGVLAAAAALAFSATAVAATPSQILAATLKTRMQAYYTKANPGFKMGAVTCKIAATGSYARCNAHFTVPPKHGEGTFVLGVTINPKTGYIKPKTLSATCFDSRTHKKLSC